MNEYLYRSIEFANQYNYLDQLYKIYPVIHNSIREIDINKWQEIEKSFKERDNITLVTSLLKLDLFPLKDSYVAFLRRDKSSINRNPDTINRLAGSIYELGLNNLYEKCSEPKESNRQMGQAFRNWIKKGIIGVPLLNYKDFSNTSVNSILYDSDEKITQWAKENLNYNREKRLDFLAYFNKKYIIGEAKFLTDFGGHQNGQLEDALSLVKLKDVNAVKVAILDGVLYIKGRNKMYNTINKYKDYNIFSALLLRDFLYSI